MIVLRLLVGLAGGALVLAVAVSALKTVVVPRSVGSLITRSVFLTVRQVFDRWLARPSLPFAVRDRRLAYFAPVGLLLLPGVWVLLALVGFTAIQTALDPDLLEAFRVSGSSLFTLGFDVHGDELPSLVLTYLAATLGLGLIGLLISYLPTIYGSFNRRETLVGQLEVRAGLPPSPAELLTRYVRIGLLDEIDTELFVDWERWFLDVEESHCSFPALVFFRSPQPGRSWVTAAGCVLDVAALYDAVVDRPRSGRTAILLRTGFLALSRIADYFGVDYDPNPRPDDPISVERREFDLLCVELEAAGVPLRDDRTRAWLDFAGWRVNYDAVLLALAGLTVAPPARWSSDRAVPLTSRGFVRRRAR